MAKRWNLFVAQSKNGTFLFDRNYMDYHCDRFTDHSMVVFRGDELYGLLPANQKGDVLYSHQGLTYGGLVLSSVATTVHVMEIFKMLNEQLRKECITRVVYKSMPWIYHTLPAEEPLYAIFRNPSCRLLERDISTTIVLDKQMKWKKDRLHGLKTALQHGILVRQSEDFASFWQILTDNLRERHGVSPVHSLDEILLLHSRFPNQILLFTASVDGEMLGGCVVYVAQKVVHTQYIAATPEGKRLGAVDAIVHTLTNGQFPYHTYFDFGKSTETHSDQLNSNLIYQKEGFGGRAICYDTYEWTL